MMKRNDFKQQASNPVQIYGGSQSQNPPQFGLNRAQFQNFGGPGVSAKTDFEDDEDWLEDAVRCKEKKHTKVIGNMKIVKITKIYTMKDGSTEVVENTLRELI